MQAEKGEGAEIEKGEGGEGGEIEKGGEGGEIEKGEGGEGGEKIYCNSRDCDYHRRSCFNRHRNQVLVVGLATLD